MIVNNLPTPCYAVIFTSILIENDLEAYVKMAEIMEELAKKQQGFLGIESARNDIGITVSYWKTLANIKLWKNQISHAYAQKLGKEKWYEQYEIKICKVEKVYGFKK